MPPKKKATRKQDDDWEAEALGEESALADGGADAEQTQGVEEPNNLGGGGALLAAIKKNKQNKKKKGKSEEENSKVQDTDIDSNQPNGHLGPNGSTAGIQESKKTDANDVFADTDSQSKTAKNIAGKKTSPQTEADLPDGDAAGLKSKKEKEKEKKERDKQRKREQVFHHESYLWCLQQCPC